MSAAKETLSRLRYGLQACVNLEQIMACMPDGESVKHFQKRQREIGREIKKLEGAR